MNTKEKFDNSIPIVLYDLSIPDINDRVKSIQIFPSIAKCSRHLKVTEKKVWHNVGKRVYSPTLDKEFAVRKYYPHKVN
jgi:hypothetical protein